MGRNEIGHRARLVGDPIGVQSLVIFVGPTRKFDRDAVIANWDTNTLFLTDRLEITDPDLFASLRSVLNGVTIEIIPSTHDIWCRDFMRIQLDENTFCKFVYDPDYLKGYPDLMYPARSVVL